MMDTASETLPEGIENWRDYLHERYRDGSPRQISAVPRILDTILSHRTVRSYLPQPLPEGAIELAIAAAQSAPTTSNLQAWSVVAITDPALKERVNNLASNQKQTTQAPVLLVWAADLFRLRRAAQMHDLPSEGLDYIEALLFGVIDAALAAQNALVAFESLGLGTCYIGAIRNNADKVAAELGLPPEVFPLFGMTVGIPDPAVVTGIKPRLPQDVVLHRNRYRPPLEEELRGYDGNLREFQAEQSMSPIDWTRQASIRVGTVEALKNRDKMRQFLQEQGFKMK